MRLRGVVDGHRRKLNALLSEGLVPLADVKVYFRLFALMLAALIIGHHFSISFLSKRAVSNVPFSKRGLLQYDGLGVPYGPSFAQPPKSLSPIADFSCFAQPPKITLRKRRNQDVPLGKGAGERGARFVIDWLGEVEAGDFGARVMG